VTSPCFGCATPCCFEYEVPLNGYDVFRLCDATGLPWQAVVTTRTSEQPSEDAVRLDAGALLTTLWLKKRGNGACALLVELPGQQHRCGAHRGRPLACRAYPLARSTRGKLTILDHALCPNQQRQAYVEAAPSMRAAVDDELAEQDLYQHLVRRWNQMARHIPRGQSFELGDFLDWLLDVYTRIHPLRVGPRESWEPTVRVLADGVDLPAPLSPAT
jgi:hypothetical protein